MCVCVCRYLDKGLSDLVRSVHTAEGTVDLPASDQHYAAALDACNKFCPHGECVCVYVCVVCAGIGKCRWVGGQAEGSALTSIPVPRGFEVDPDAHAWWWRSHQVQNNFWLNKNDAHTHTHTRARTKSKTIFV